MEYHRGRARHGQLRTPTMGYTTEIGMRLRLWLATLT